MRELAGSERSALSAARLGDVPNGRPIRLTVVLRPGAALPAHGASFRPMSRAEFRERYATRPKVVDAFTQFVTSHGLRVVSADAGTHTVRLAGTYGQARAAFQPDELGLYRAHGREIAARNGALRVPPEFESDVVAVLGFDQRPIARPHFRFRPNASRAYTFDPRAVAERYGFPPDLDGTGQTIALIELGGGYDDAEVAAYFARHGVKRTGKLIAVPVSGSGNARDGDPNGADGEVQLDIDVAGSVAPGANLAVYFAPNQGSGFLDAIQAALHGLPPGVDPGSQVNNPAVISISWGGPEAGWPAQDVAAMEQALQAAMALGVTVIAASGDDGAQDQLEDGGLHVDYPASSPYVLGCGGTRLPRSGPEAAWNDGPGQGASGGGFSTLFPVPEWQKAALGTLAEGQAGQRGVPDVAGDADPATGYNVSVDGHDTVAGGTSAVAPLWAALIALANQKLGQLSVSRSEITSASARPIAPVSAQPITRVGFVNATLYAHPEAFNDVTSGNNRGFEARAGWDPVTGLGTPKGAAVVDALGSAAAVS